jgi:Photosynthesis affected mutant 68
MTRSFCLGTLTCIVLSGNEYMQTFMKLPLGDVLQVNDRILKRIIVFSGVPVFVGFLLYPLFYYVKVGLQIDLPIWVVYLVQVFTFGGGLLGITYGVLSSSWDPDRENSTLLGINEFKANLPIVLESMRNRK